jgi:hypothetical protein
MSWHGHCVLIVDSFSIFAYFSGSAVHNLGGKSLYVPHTHFMFRYALYVPLTRKMREVWKIWKLSMNLLGTVRNIRQREIKRFTTYLFFHALIPFCLGLRMGGEVCHAHRLLWTICCTAAMTASTEVGLPSTSNQ